MLTYTDMEARHSGAKDETIAVIDDRLSQKLSLMSLIAAAMVVMIHSFPQSAYTHFIGRYVVAALTDGICEIAVPYFFLASGFFFASHIREEGWYRRELKKRIRTIVIPFVIWCLIYGIYMASRKVVGNICSGREIFANFPHGWIALSWIGLYPLDRPIYGLLWFLRALMVYFFISPLLVFLVRKFGWCFICFLFLLFLLVNALYPLGSGAAGRFFYFVFSVRGLAYFTLGIQLRRSPQTWRRAPFALIPGIALIVLGMFTSHIAYMRHMLAVGLLLWGVFSILPDIHLSAFWRSVSFPIFLTHSFFSEPLLVFMGGQTVNCVVLAVFVFVVSLIASICLARMIRTFPRVAAVLFGFR